MRCRTGLVAGIVLLTAAAAFAADGLVIGNIKIVGNDKTDPRVILTEMWLGKGDPYSKEAVEEARQNVMNLRYFRSVEITEEVDRAAGVMNLTVRVKERITWGIVPILSLDGDDPDNNEYGLRIDENSLFGYGKTISVRGSAADTVVRYAVSYSDPQVLYTHFTAGAGVSVTNTDTDAYDDDVTYGYITGGYRLTYETTVALQIALREDDYSNAAVALALPNNVSTTYVTLGLSYNDVNYYIDSLNGIGASISVQSGSGDYDFTKVTASLLYYRTMMKDHWIKLSLSGGTTNDIDGDTHTILNESYALGGGTTIRGYVPSYKTGDRFVLASAQYEVPVWHPAMFGFTGTMSVVGFLDYGNAWWENTAVAALAGTGDSGDYVAGAGVGIRGYVNELQAFTFAFDLGYGFEEEEFQPHLSFGGSF